MDGVGQINKQMSMTLELTDIMTGAKDVDVNQTPVDERRITEVDALSVNSKRAEQNLRRSIYHTEQEHLIKKRLSGWKVKTVPDSPQFSK